MDRCLSHATPLRRRAYLVGVASGALSGLAGCLSGGTSVSVLAAGSLAVLFEETVGPAFEEETGIDFRGEYHGSNALLRMVEDGTKRPDVVISADVSLLRDRLIPTHAKWDVEFAANEVGIAYEESTTLGRRLADGEPWYEVLSSARDGAIAISEPDLDPLGYRAVHLLDLAEREYDLDGFRDRVLERAYREPDEPQLLAGVRTGNRACAIAYRNMAIDHGIPFYELPDAYNFANPTLEAHYATASYTTSEGYTVRGSPVVYNATVRANADDSNSGLEFLSFLLDRPTVLEDHGLRVDASLPRTNGDAPPEVRQ